MNPTLQIAVLGGGAAGFFAAIRAAESNPLASVHIFERSADFLEKVRISGGGRCNVCPSEFDPRQLVKYYPRGGKALLGPFNTFCSGDTVGWYEDRGVALKTEADGRMFPVTDDSETIVQCLLGSAMAAGVKVHRQSLIKSFMPLGDGWQLEFSKGESQWFDRLLLAPGSSKTIWMQLEKLGHKIVPPVASLFTFHVNDPRIEGLQGLSVPFAQLRATGLGHQSEGPLLITHWGFSGPATLKLSAWGAREMAACGYSFDLEINWMGGQKLEQAAEMLRQQKQAQAKRKVQGKNPFDLPNRLWNALCQAAKVTENMNWADLSKVHVQALAQEMVAGIYKVSGKSTFKEEFVTCGGLSLDEVNFKTMESKLLPGLYFAGEVLDIDAVTGGYNFQAAWTTGWIAGTALAQV